MKISGVFRIFMEQNLECKIYTFLSMKQGIAITLKNSKKNGLLYPIMIKTFVFFYLWMADSVFFKELKKYVSGIKV